MNPFLRRNWFTVKNQLAMMVGTVSIEESESLMVGASKILTVSYGTFSCTLEGFDEPFSTMKAIAEYFRDLAADDRYFGAEPPTPDAEMLHRIAEREMHRRVEAKIGAHGITLRPQEPFSPIAAKPDPDGVQAQPGISAEESAPEPQSAVAAAPAQQALLAPEAGSIEDSVAAKLARIRAAVAGARVAAAQPVYEDEPTSADFFAAAPDGDFGFDIDLGGPLQSEPEQDQIAVKPETSASDAAPAPVAEAAASADAAPDAASDAARQQRRAIRRAARAAKALAALTNAAAPADAAAPEAVADAAAEAPAAAPAEEPAEEPFEADLVAPETEAATGDLSFDNLDANAIGIDQPDAEPSAVFAPETAPTDTLLPDAFEGEVEAAAEPEPEDAAPQAAEPQAAAEPAAEPGDETGIAEVLGISAAETADAPAPEMDFAPETDAVAETANDANIWDDAEPDEAYLEATPPEPEPQAEQPRPRARVITVRRAETPAVDAPAPAEADAAPPADATEPNDADTLAAVSAALAEPDPRAEEAVLLSPEDEAELARELAELEAETAPAPAKANAGDNDDDDDVDENLFAAIHGEPAAAPEPSVRFDPDTDSIEIAAVAAPRAPREAAAEPAEADLTRLITETNTKLQGKENRRRFSAIAHLKAAVAATVADRKLRSADEAAAAEADEARDLERYRDDLTKAVRPRRPATAEAATQRPAAPEHRPAPLVLVSEQRIDRARVAPASEQHVIRPRRVSVGQAAAALRDDDDAEEFDETPMAPSEARNFAEFAERLGARELPELLEAAAAYTARVEGQPHFSRPQIIRKVAALATADGYDREAGLRSFGRLLRQGKIAKVKRGQYAITEASRFYPPAASAR